MNQLDKYSILKEFFGHSHFREGQENIIDAILSGRDCLGIMPTGAGKSICYQVPALMFDGITVVVSPLISLMKDQVNSLIQSGVKAAYLNSSLSPAQYETAISNAKKGMYKIIYVAPERLCTQSFLSLARYVKISMLTVDEAHCVSQWGQDFRPSYMKIPEFLSMISYRPVVSAFTATATTEVRDDISRMLELKDPFCLTTGFDRKNLYFEVMHPKDKYEQTKLIVEENKDKCGIIYCSTRKNVETVCAKLCADGYNATRYHAGLSDDERRKNQDDFIFDRVPVIVATNAFGMGIDKSNVSYVIHYNMPKNIESYYQEAGRAGRDGAEAKCILLFSNNDVRTNKFLIENSSENTDLDEETAAIIKKKDMLRLKAMTDYCNTSHCLRNFILKYFGETPFFAICGKCSNCSCEFEEIDITIEAQKILSCIYRLHQRDLHFGAGVIAQILQGSNNEKIRQYDLQTLSTYGIMKDCTQIKIRQITSFLISKGYICEGEHMTLTLSRKSAEVLMDKKYVCMILPKEQVRKPMGETVTLYDTSLFDRLKKVRSKIASDASMPAYIIFTDSTLREMCIKLPKNTSQFLAISGVGKSKQEKYGRYFIDEIKKFLEEDPDAEQRVKDISASAENKKDVFSYLKNNADKLESKDIEMTLNQVCDDMLTQLGVAADKRIVKSAVRKWLISENYLCEKMENGYANLRSTILSAEAGIQEVEKISSFNRPYTCLVFPKAAQDFIYSNIEDIVKFHKKDSKR